MIFSSTALHSLYKLDSYLVNRDVSAGSRLSSFAASLFVDNDTRIFIYGSERERR